MQQHLPYYEPIRLVSQQLASGLQVLRSIDHALAEGMKEASRELIHRFTLLDSRIQAIESHLVQKAAPRPWLDNADMKHLFNIGDTKLGELKRGAYFPIYDLNGKDMYYRPEVDEAVRRHPKSFKR